MAQPAKKAATRKGWKYITGTRGKNRIRVFAWPAQGEHLWIDYQEDGKRLRRSLGHSDKARAIREAEEIAAGLGTLDAIRAPAALTLQTLFDMYEREVTPQKGKTARAHDTRTLPLLLRAFGADRKPKDLDVRDWNNYIRRRQLGELAPQYKHDAKGRVVFTPVRARIIEQDLKLLLAVLNWAERLRADSAGYLLERNPLRGLKLPKEDSPKRATFTQEQCAMLRRVAAEHSAIAERFVMLAWYTGQRSSAIRQLRWSDIDLDNGVIRWRADTDKLGYEHRNPMHRDLGVFLKHDRARTKAIGDAWVFPAPRDSSQPMPRDTSQKLWERLAKAAGITRGGGYGWHSFRRAFANALRDVPPRELKDLGGWKSMHTVQTVYLQPDEQAQRRALESIASTA